MELRALSRGRATCLLFAVVALAAAAMLASPAASTAKPKLVQPSSQTKAPEGYRLTAKRVIAIAARGETIRAEERRHKRFAPTAYTRGAGRWQVSWFEDGREVAQARVDDFSGAILEQWRGEQVAWTMARGYEGAFGRKLNAPYIWLPLCLLFLLPFVDPRKPFRLLHLDLLALLGFGASHFFFNRGEIATSVPLLCPVLLYLLGRLLWAGFRPRDRSQKLVPIVPITWLVIGAVFLVGFRGALNVVDSNVVDVGYAGVLGADRIADGKDLYGEGFSRDVERGDTYGPVIYLAYVPFEQVIPWSGAWDDLPAAHGVALLFDLLTMIGLVALGRRIRPGPEGRDLGIALGFAWAAYPYAAFALETNSNDAMISAGLVGAMLALTSTPVRGLVVGLTGAAKYAPLVVAPVFATGIVEGARARLRAIVIFSAVVAVVLAATFVPFIPDGGLSELYDRSLGYQAARESPFSVWGRVDGIETLHTIAKALVVLLAVAVAFVPRRRGPVQVAALAAAVLIALQLTAGYWFYLYITWFAPLALVAFMAPLRGSPDRDEGDGTRSETAVPVAA